MEGIGWIYIRGCVVQEARVQRNGGQGGLCNATWLVECMKISMMLNFLCALLVLCSLPSLMFAVTGGDRTLPNAHNNNINQARGGSSPSWWWGVKGGLRRSRSMLQCYGRSASSESRGSGCGVLKISSGWASTGLGYSTVGQKEESGSFHVARVRYY